MPERFTTLTSLHKPCYGDWAGNPKGFRPDPSRCCVEVRAPGRWPSYSQCGRRRGFGEEGAYCRQHEPVAAAERAAAKEAARRTAAEEKAARVAQARVRHYAGDVLLAIARGSNDPRGLAAGLLHRHGLLPDDLSHLIEDDPHA